MKQTLYGDVLFLVNFSMDYLTLFITARLLHRKIWPKRLILAAAIGGIYGVAACFMGGTVLWKLITDIAVSLLLCYISFSEGLMPCCAIFYIAGFLLGGVATAALSFIDSIEGTRAVFADGSYRTLQGDIPLGWMAVIAALAGIAAIVGGRISSRAKATESVDLEVMLFGSMTKLVGIVDSGNMLTDVISGAPVIVVTKSAMTRVMSCSDLSSSLLNEILSFEDVCEIASLLPPELGVRTRLIPAATVAGGGLMLGIRCDSVMICGVEREAMLALGDGERYGEGEALVPSALI